jgi:predicted transposase YbfD/YdcC
VVCVLEDAGGLRAHLAAVPDPRKRRGRRHSLVSILLITICALAAGKDGYTHIHTWALDAPPQALAALDVRHEAPTGRFTVPDEKTIRTLMGRVNTAALTAATVAWLADLDQGRANIARAEIAEREARRARAHAAKIGPDARAIPPAFAADGKRLAGARRPDGTHVHLLSLTSHTTGATLAQHEINAKTNEIPELAVLLHGVDLTGAVLTLDALHTQRETAALIAEQHQGFYLMTVKANQPTLQAAIAARLIQPSSHYQQQGRYHVAENRGHGRVEQRQIRTADADGIDFPHAAQVIHVIRRSRPLSIPAGWTHKEHVYAITNLPHEMAGPAALAHAARGHWSIENKSHYVRDVTFGEDASQTRTGHAPANLASLRNLVIGTLRHAGHANIAHARTLIANRYERALTLFDL